MPVVDCLPSKLLLPTLLRDAVSLRIRESLTHDTSIQHHP
jgi:hypothetical protein